MRAPEASREQRVRRLAQRLDLAVTKSRRDGTFGIIDPYLDVWVFCDPRKGYGQTLHEIEVWLTEAAQAE
jgi:predicted RNA-binding protein associated with RNAse of E/G family